MEYIITRNYEKLGIVFAKNEQEALHLAVLQYGMDVDVCLKANVTSKNS